MLPRRISLPVWSVPAIVAALYIARSLTHGDWRPELPTDAIVLVMTAIVMAAVAELRSSLASDDAVDDDNRASRDDAGGPVA